MTAYSEDIIYYFDRWLRRHRFLRAWFWIQVGLVSGLGAAHLLALLAIERKYLLPREFLYLIAGLSGTGVVLGGLIAYFWPVQRLKTARTFDRQFGLEERLSTALELLNKPASATREESSEEQELNERQWEDTLQFARRVNPRNAQPLQLNKLVLSLGLAFAVGLGIIWVNGEASFRAASLHRETRRIIAEETYKLEDLQQDVAALENINPEDRENLVETLQTSIEDLKTSETLESALSTLNQAEQNLAALTDPAVDQTIQSIQRIGEQLQANGGPLPGITEEMARGDLSTLAEDIASLSTSELSREEKRALVENINQIAQALENTDPGLAEDLQQTAETLQSADSSVADEALGDLAQTITEMSQAQSMNQAAEGIANQVEMSAQALLSQAQSGAGSQASLSGSAQEGADSGQGQGDSAPASQNGQTSGSGAGRGEGDQVDDEGSIAGVDPISQGNAPGDGGETDFEQVFPPQRLGGEDDLLVTIPGSGDTGGQVIGQGETQSGTSGPLTVPYYEIYPAYQQAYQKAISSGDIPLALRPLVRDYFSSLEPK